MSMRSATRQIEEATRRTGRPRTERASRADRCRRVLESYPPRSLGVRAGVTKSAPILREDRAARRVKAKTGGQKPATLEVRAGFNMRLGNSCPEARVGC